MANQPPPTTQGPIHAVQCPHCGRNNDYRALKSQQLLDTGHCVFCDHCKRSMEVVKIATIEVIVVRRDPSGKVAPEAVRAIRQRQQQLANKPQGLLQRLLGKGNG